MLAKREFLLTEHQRLMLGTDRWFTVKEIAECLEISEQTVHSAIKRGSLIAFKVPQMRGAPITKVKGWRVMIWRDRRAGVSDGPEEKHGRVA